ncbi:MAG: DUF5681 domain-containing protein [Thiobacillus sp.]|jgi:hypothetical protein
MTTRKTTWKKGQSGNPAGRPRGTRNKATLLALNLMEDAAAEITQAVITAARMGDLAAAKLVLERLAPPLRERPISIELPDTSTTAGVSKAQQVIIEAVGKGELLPGEGSTLAALVESRRRALETEDLERRLNDLEEQQRSRQA